MTENAGDSGLTAKSGRREIFRQGEVWDTQGYFVYLKWPKPKHWRKRSVVRRRRAGQRPPEQKERSA